MFSAETLVIDPVRTNERSDGKSNEKPPEKVRRRRLLLVHGSRVELADSGFFCFVVVTAFLSGPSSTAGTDGPCSSSRVTAVDQHRTDDDDFLPADFDFSPQVVKVCEK